MLKYNRFNIANSVICTMNSNYRMAATLYCGATQNEVIVTIIIIVVVVAAVKLLLLLLLLLLLCS
jgi:hypothetical protein